MGPFGEGQINVSDRVHKNEAKFANLTNDWNWEMVAQDSVLSIECTAEYWFGQL